MDTAETQTKTVEEVSPSFPSVFCPLCEVDHVALRVEQKSKRLSDDTVATYRKAIYITVKFCPECGCRIVGEVGE